MLDSNNTSADPDPLLDAPLDLEDRFYSEGYDLGVNDGARAGFMEGSVFAVENGFEKFIQMGKFYGKAIIWAKRLPGGSGEDLLRSPASSSSQQQQHGNGNGSGNGDNGDASGKVEGSGESSTRVACASQNTEFKKSTSKPLASSTPNGVGDGDNGGFQNLPPLPKNPRLEKHITTLLSLVDPLTLPTENTEDAVADFDDRLKKAAAKVKIIERIIGEDQQSNNDAGQNGQQGEAQNNKSGNIEDIGPLPPRLSNAE